MKNSSGSKANILIVDDNPQNLQVLGNFLKETGYRIEFALSGRSALEWIENREFDLILLDVMMPEINGLEVCRNIRRNKKYSNLPIIFISADYDKETILEGFEIGGQDYITKPFDQRELHARVKTQLDLKFINEELHRLNENLESTVQERTSQLNEALNSLEKANRELEEIEQIKTDFLNIISHEIRTPLNGILGPLELLRLKLDDPSVLKLVDMLDQSVTRLEKFSYSALLITELRTKQRQIEAQPLILNEIINAIAVQDNNTLLKKNISLQVKHNITNLAAMGDRHLLTNCLQCLLERNIRMAPVNGKIIINSGVIKDAPYCEILNEEFSLPEKLTREDLRIFEQEDHFADNNPALDFALGHLVMKAHGGKLEIRNMEGGGIKFILLFPPAENV